MKTIILEVDKQWNPAISLGTISNHLWGTWLKITGEEECVYIYIYKTRSLCCIGKIDGTL